MSRGVLMASVWNCLSCGEDFATRARVVRDFVICLGCGYVMTFDDYGEIRALTATEANVAARRPEIRAIIDTVRR